jgi:carbamoyltransferase
VTAAGARGDGPRPLDRGADPVVLGLHAWGHEAGACLATSRGLWALSEERLSRKKYDGGFPRRSIAWALGASGVASLAAVDLVVYDLCEMKGRDVERELRALGYEGAVRACRHHEAHAASAFFVSPFEDAAVLTLDAGGSREAETGPGVAPSILGASAGMHRELQALFRGTDNRLHGIRRTASAPPWNVNPGVLYGMSSVYLGFGPMGSGKLMGLAAHGAPEAAFRSPVFESFDGEPLARFPGPDALREADAIRWLADLFAGVPRRAPGDALTDRHANVAAFVQAEAERAVLALARHLAAVTASPRLCFAGGFALNVTTNRKLLDETPFRDLFVQPAASDAGIPLGCALFGYHAALGRPRRFTMPTAALGGEYSAADVDRAVAERPSLRAQRVEAIERRAAEAIARGKIVGWFQGRSELGPRALGHRSILADPRDARSVMRLNEEIKHREPFRPYAPMVLEADAATYFDLAAPSPHMLLSATVHGGWRERLPAIVHRDGSARVQTVSPRDEPRLAALLEAFRAHAGVPVLLNTSFNRDAEPIVETPGDALDVLLATTLDAVVLGETWVEKAATAAAEKTP